MDFRGFVANMAEPASAQSFIACKTWDLCWRETDLCDAIICKIFLETLAVGKQQSCMRTDGGGGLSNI